MSLKHTILGFLNNQDLSGYDLQKKIENTINHFWPSTQSQIYRTLKELTDARLVDMQMFYQDDKPNKKVYSITIHGKNELIRWLSSDIDLQNTRNQFLVQFFFSDCIDDKTIIKNLEYYKLIMQNRLSFMTSQQISKQIKGGINEKRKKLVSLIAQNGIWALENEISWIEFAINTIKGEK